ncbi:MAG TPA: aminoglycoside phosphotransferase family protein [Aliidongia sp.]|uniref:aminoglycoside phosphotransferase family protein n=1 Tax=Aliidongia sp. TaxID=1914230 RepID=UPI002DDCA7E3|nr:aminoglycoside phosphotransferase family protein [Aliidongia sp.]HEV2678742.1 aminoglycoside phosphotransferase family protein [Aliidongia sp.]
MTPTGTPAAEIEIDEALVRSLLHEQHPDLAGLPIQPAASGWDNVMFRLGDDLCVRLPRRAASAALLVTEQRWLPTIADGLPLPVSAARRIGRPGTDFPWHWNVVSWLPGRPADLDVPRPDQAERWAGFLRALHRPAPANAPRNAIRGCPLSNRIGPVAARLDRLRGKTDISFDRIDAIWHRALAASIDVEPTWLHGDLHAQNVLTDDGRLSAVIDWGDMARGDRATDLASIWMLLPGDDDRQRAIEAYDLPSSATWDRARGWAVLFGSMLLDVGLTDNPRFAITGEHILRRLVEDA